MARTLGFLFIFTLIHSCAVKSGKYVKQNGKWVFVEQDIGFLDKDLFRNHFEGLSDSEASRFHWPVPSSQKISSFYGKRFGRHHAGIDIPAKRGSHILSAEEGRVIFSGHMKGYGKMIVVEHSGGLHSVYAHNKVNYVRVGQKVSAKEAIGQIGNTGRSTGPHLHFEIRKNGKHKDPLPFLGPRGRSIASKSK